MVKKIIFGIIWFFVFSWVGVPLTGMIYAIANPDVPKEEAFNTLQSYSVFIYAVAAVIAAVGTYAGKLPGTKK